MYTFLCLCVSSARAFYLVSSYRFSIPLVKHFSICVHHENLIHVLYRKTSQVNNDQIHSSSVYIRTLRNFPHCVFIFHTQSRVECTWHTSDGQDRAEGQLLTSAFAVLNTLKSTNAVNCSISSMFHGSSASPASPPDEHFLVDNGEV